MKSLTRFALVVCGTMALVLAGCGGSSDPGNITDTGQPEPDNGNSDTITTDTPPPPDVDPGCKSDEECAAAVDLADCQGAVCNDDGTCSTALLAEGTACDDSNICTENDACSADGACAGTGAEGTDCDDSNICTENDACSADGACAGTAIDGCEKGCDWLIDPVSFDAETAADECAPKVSLTGASINNGALSVGPTDFNFSFPLGELSLDLVISQGRFIGDVVGAFDLIDARLCGAIDKAVLTEALNKACEVPTEGTEQLCSLKGIVLSLLNCDPCTIVLGMDGVEAKSMTLDTVDPAEFPACQPPATLASAGSHVTSMWLPLEASGYDCDSNNDGKIDGTDGDLNGLIKMAGSLAADFDINATLAENIADGDLIFLPAISGYTGGNADNLDLQFYIGSMPQPGFPDECDDVE
jgi:hypothetical protein